MTNLGALFCTTYAIIITSSTLRSSSSYIDHVGKDGSDERSLGSLEDATSSMAEAVPCWYVILTPTAFQLLTLVQVKISWETHTGNSEMR